MLRSGRLSCRLDGRLCVARRLRLVGLALGFRRHYFRLERSFGRHRRLGLGLGCRGRGRGRGSCRWWAGSSPPLNPISAFKLSSKKKKRGKDLDVAVLDHAPLLSTFQRVVFCMRGRQFPTHVRQAIKILKRKRLDAVDMDYRYRLEGCFCICSSAHVVSKTNPLALRQRRIPCKSSSRASMIDAMRTKSEATS